MNAKGILAVWNDCSKEYIAEYEAWYQSEHLPQRVSVPGFFCGRRYEALTPGPQFFTYYEVEGPAVLTSLEYLEVLENPTPETRRIMKHAFLNMNRTVCSREVLIDGASGGCVVTLAWADEEPAFLSPETITKLAPQRVEIWRASLQSSGLSAEERIRGVDDQKISNAILLEFLREEEALNAVATIGGQGWRLLASLKS
jgi:hypothetical protein